MWLLIDDMKDLSCDVIARTAAGARAILGGIGYAFDGMCIDHDLGGDETGYDILKWGFEAEVLPKHIQLVTMNPVGRVRMAKLLEDHGYKSTDGSNYFKQ